MAEKVIHEFRFIETDDGFRIEIKGDKEKMRQMGFGPGLAKLFSCGAAFDFEFPGGMRFRHGRKGRGYRHSPPWNWWDWGEEEDEPPKKA